MKHFERPPSAAEQPEEIELETNKRIESPFESFKESEEGVLVSIAKKMGKRIAPVAAALSLFMGASSAYGSEVASEIESIKSVTKIEEVIKVPSLEPKFVEPDAKIAEVKNIPSHDSKSEYLFNKISFNVGGTIEKIPSLPIGFKEKYSLSTQEILSVSEAYGDTIRSSAHADDFFRSLGGINNLDDRRKVELLRGIGMGLNFQYNEDMVNNREYVAVSDEMMFQSLKAALKGEKLPGGICANIATFVEKSAKALGMESWIQDGLEQGGGHVIDGLVAGEGKEKEIVFLDGGDVTRTGTLNFSDAIGMREQFLGKVSTFETFIGDDKKVMYPVKSRAQEITSAFVGMQRPQKEVELLLGEGAIRKTVDGLEFALSPETRVLSLNSGHVGLSFSNYTDTFNNPYQSLRVANALRGGGHFKGERFGLDADATLMFLSVKNFKEGAVDFNSIASRVFANYIEEFHLTKGEYGELKARLGATLQAAISMAISSGSFLSQTQFSAETSAGVRLLYLDPQEKGQFYIGVSGVGREQQADFQTQRPTVVNAAKQFSLGAKLKVQEGLILGLDASHAAHDWGKATEAKAGVQTKLGSAEVGYKKEKSAYERFVPSTEEISGSVSYTDNPKFEVRIFGFKKTEQYKDVKPHDEYQGQVQFVLKFF